MTYDEYFGIIECVLFVSGDPVATIRLQRLLGVTDLEMSSIIRSMEEKYEADRRGVRLFVTPDSIQLVSNSEYAPMVQKLLQPTQEKSFSQSMLETLSVIAYRQPVTRADIESVRGVRCEYAVSQLLKFGFICELGRKNVIGRPMLFGTTDAFLRHFGIHSLDELPPLSPSDEESLEELMPNALASLEEEGADILSDEQASES